MATVNLDSIFKRVKTYSETPQGKEKMRQAVLQKKKSGNGMTAEGSEILTEIKMNALASELIAYLKMTAASYDLAPSVMAHFSSLTYVVQDVGNGNYEFHIYFADDLSRESLDIGEWTEDDGIRNIIALFNNGYVASAPKYGWWWNHAPTGEAMYRGFPGDSHTFIKSKQARASLLFMQRAILDFNSKYAGKYKMSIILDDIYEGDFITSL